ncbi:FMN-binding protein [Streptacidiphilus rugosus]|uniref:FMN-binding protein n=1 Tax=Streptacidiphilus rugosus TaxID=405783 RepID=UPI000566854B|nr:FMN-binding protein [Streptacidiphilus rugosus]
MRRAIVTTTATAAGVVLLLSLKPHGTTTAGQAPIISAGSDTSTSTGTGTGTGTDSGSTDTSSGGSGSTASSTPKASSSAAPKSTAKSTPKAATTSSYTGSAVDTRYGPVQVRISVRSGKLSKVDVLQYPSGSQRDADINSYALPVLNQEALAAGNASIDMVSGATYTSTGYIQSLQSALDQAGLK